MKLESTLLNFWFEKFTVNLMENKLEIRATREGEEGGLVKINKSRDVVYSTGNIVIS